MTQVLKVKKLYKDARLPEKIRNEDVGWDLFAYEPIQFTHHLDYKKVRTGIAIELPPGYYGRIVSRSSSMDKKDILVIEGTIDNGYHGELIIQVLKVNWDGFIEQRLNKWDKIAQLIVTKMEDTVIEEVDELGKSERGEKGFGSTDGWDDLINAGKKYIERGLNAN